LSNHVNPDGVPYENFEVVSLKRQEVTVLSRAATPALDEVTEKDYVDGIILETGRGLEDLPREQGNPHRSDEYVRRG